jgi:mono/diheme cytochrome c family protein
MASLRRNKQWRLLLVVIGERKVSAMTRKFWASTVGIVIVCAVIVAGLNLRDESTVEPIVSTKELVERGRYLALVGNCAGCHTLPGNEPYSGGYGVPTPYGVIYAGNLTPHKEQGIGTWSNNDFWRALHNGRSKDGRLLYPAFPYTSYSKVTQQDSNALYAYLASLPPSAAVNKPHTLQFPYNTQAALAVWRALYFKPGVHVSAGTATNANNEIDLGGYLVQGLGHCDACHAPRDRLGGVSDVKALSGGIIPTLNWYAPSLATTSISNEVATYLKVGKTGSHYASGPMAEVVFGSTQYLTDSDAKAMQSYLANLPRDLEKRDSRAPASSEVGAKVYKDSCEGCHGKNGEGVKGAYPALAANPAVLQHTPASLVRMIVEGGFGAATAGNPQPYGMPPYGQVLTPLQIAGVITHIRSSFGNKAGFVSEIEVIKYR